MPEVLLTPFYHSGDKCYNMLLGSSNWTSIPVIRTGPEYYKVSGVEVGDLEIGHGPRQDFEKFLPPFTTMCFSFFVERFGWE